MKFALSACCMSAPTVEVEAILAQVQTKMLPLFFWRNREQFTRAISNYVDTPHRQPQG